MSFDDDIRKRFDQVTPQIEDVESGAAAAATSSQRRTAVTRVAAAGAAALILLVGVVAVSTLGDEPPSEIRTADPTPLTAPPTPTEAPSASTVPVDSAPVELSTTGIATVDVNDVVRINDEIVDAETWIPILETAAGEPSVGPDGQILSTEEIDGCTRISIVDDSGEQVADHPVARLSRCIPGELADWSTSGHVVLVSPTQEDAWSITVIAADGRSAQLTSPGAFQPLQLDVHTDAAGRTQALVLGTGEELVYIDVDAFLVESAPGLAIRGISNETNLVSAQFVEGVEQHSFQAQVDDVIAGHATVPDLPPQPAMAVWAVAGVEANDTLNARSGPGIEFDIVFELAPDATGVVQVGEATSTDGALWFQVYAPNSGTGVETGWVNSTFLTETSVADARPCLFNGPQDHYIGLDWTNPEGSADSDASVISNIETYRFGGCIRTVIEFSDAWSYEDGGANRVTALPTDIVVTRDTPPTIDFGASITGAEAADARFEEAGGVAQSTFVSLGADFPLDGVLYGPTTTMTATFDNTNGTMIIDIADIRLPADADPGAFDQVGPKTSALIDEAGIVLTDVTSSVNEQRWTFTGLARPFESTMGVQVRNTSGSPVDVDWIGGVLEGARAENGVMTTTWSEAWGQFEFTITLPMDVDPLTVLVDFDPSGGAADDPEIVTVSLADFAR